jgi:hypothetical protein
MDIAIEALSSAIKEYLSIPGQLGVIHSVFDRAVNIKLDRDPRIIALTFSQTGGLPYSLIVADGQFNSFMAGQKVTLTKDQCLVIEGVDILFDFSKAASWSPVMESLTDPDDIGAFLDLLRWSSRYVFQHANHAGIVSLLENYHLLFEGKNTLRDESDQRIAFLAAPFISALLSSLVNGNESTLTNSITRLLGYGIGGTPSGDDLLVGMLAAMHRSQHAHSGQYLQELSTTLSHQLTETVTSLLSLTVLRHALAGEFSEKIQAVTRLLMHPDDPVALQNSLKRLLMHGATSGSEMFLGICLGFELIYGTWGGNIHTAYKLNE